MKLDVISARTPAGAENYKPEMTGLCVATFMQSHPLIPLLEFHDVTGDAEYIELGATASGGVGRAKGSDFTASNEVRNWSAPSLKVFGDAKTFDQAEQRRGKNMSDLALRSLKSLSRYAAFNFANKLIHGTVSTSMWDGIATLCSAGQKVPLGTNGAVIPLGNSDTNRALQQGFFEALDIAISKISGVPTVIMLNSKLHSRVTNIYREAFRWVKSDPGIELPTYAGIPFVPMGFDSSGSETLPFTETVGSSTTCSSIYIASIAEGDNFSIGTNTGLNVYFSKANEKYRLNPEGDFVPMVFNTLALSAVTGAKLS